MKKPEGCPKITVLICALNEAKSLPYVLPKIPDWVDEILLVNGHSVDETVEITKKINPDIRILCQPGHGKANALEYGVKQATGEIIVTLDADGETDPSDISRFIEPILNGYDLAKGSRLIKGQRHGKSLYRWFGNKVLASTCNLLYNTRFTDVCSGYNAFRKAGFLKLGLTYNMKEAGCSMDQQMIVRTKKAGMKIKEIPHTSYGRIAGVSAIDGFTQATKQGFTIWFTIIKERFNG